VLVDSGAAVHFIHADLVKELSRDTWNSGDAINIITVSKEPIGTGITHQTVISLFVIDTVKQVFILGHPWLAVVNENC